MNACWNEQLDEIIQGHSDFLLQSTEKFLHCVAETLVDPSDVLSTGKLFQLHSLHSPFTQVPFAASHESSAVKLSKVVRRTYIFTRFTHTSVPVRDCRKHDPERTETGKRSVRNRSRILGQKTHPVCLYEKLRHCF